MSLRRHLLGLVHDIYLPLALVRLNLCIGNDLLPDIIHRYSSRFIMGNRDYIGMIMGSGLYAGSAFSAWIDPVHGMFTYKCICKYTCNEFFTLHALTGNQICLTDLSRRNRHTKMFFNMLLSYYTVKIITHVRYPSGKYIKQQSANLSHLGSIAR